MNKEKLFWDAQKLENKNNTLQLWGDYLYHYSKVLTAGEIKYLKDNNLPLERRAILDYLIIRENIFVNPSGMMCPSFIDNVDEALLKLQEVIGYIIEQRKLKQKDADKDLIGEAEVND